MRPVLKPNWATSVPSRFPLRSWIPGSDLSRVAAVFTGGLVSLLAATHAYGQQDSPGPESQPAPATTPAPELQPAGIDTRGALILIRSTLMALQHANQTGNYTVLRDLGAPGFHTANTAARLAEVFSSLRTQGVDLSAVAVLDPLFTQPPAIGPNGMMRMAGFFLVGPAELDFQLLFASVRGAWRLYGISLNAKQSTVSAQSGAATAAESSPSPAGADAAKSEPARPNVGQGEQRAAQGNRRRARSKLEQSDPSSRTAPATSNEPSPADARPTDEHPKPQLGKPRAFSD